MVKFLSRPLVDFEEAARLGIDLWSKEEAERLKRLAGMYADPRQKSGPLNVNKNLLLGP